MTRVVNAKGLARAPFSLWLFALPVLILLAVFLFYPLYQVLHYASWDWSGMREHEVIGSKNFQRLWRDPEFWHSLRVTAQVMLLILPSFLVLSFSIALAIENTPVARFVKALLFMPSLITVAGSAIAWYLLYDPDYGFITELTRQATTWMPCSWRDIPALQALLPAAWGELPLPCYGLTLPWRDSPWAAKVYISLFTLWQIVGYGVLVASAALKGIPQDVREAAKIDGANASQLRWHIILPLLRPSAIFLLIMGTVFSIQSYTAVFLLTQGAPFGATRVLGYYLYELGFRNFELGYAAALTLVILTLTLLVAFVQMLLLRPYQH